MTAKEVSFTGPGAFSEKTREHIVRTVYAVVSGLLTRLNLPCPGFSISAVNLGAASFDHRGLTISGFSADAPIFLAMAAAALKMNVPTDFLCTGHIASPDGDIRMVGALPAKLAAASADRSIKRFAYPDPTADGSLRLMLGPQEVAEVDAALAEAKRSLSLIPVKDVADLLKGAFSLEQLVLASLQNGYFGAETTSADLPAPLDRAAEHLKSDLKNRFWSALETRLLAGRDAEAKYLIEAFVHYHLACEEYPSAFGKRFLGLLASIPPATRRLKLKFPLLSASVTIDLARFAQPADQPDVLFMLKAMNGEVSTSTKPEVRPDPNPTSPRSVSDSILEELISLIGTESLAERINIPVDSARAVYILDSVLARTYEDFNDTVTSFAAHLLRRVHGADGSVPAEAFSAEAFALLERAFARKGGSKGALLEAQTGCQGWLTLRSGCHDRTVQGGAAGERGQSSAHRGL